MPQMHTLLTRIDYAVMSLGGLILAVVAAGWLRRGRDPLHGSPIRANSINLLTVWLCVTTYAGGLAFGQAMAFRWAPATLDEEGRAAWTGVFAVNLTQVLVSVVCLGVGALTFRAGIRGYGLGRRSFSAELRWAFCLLPCTVCLCAGLSMLIEQLSIWLDYSPPEHKVFTMLRDSTATPMMRRVAFMGALLLAPIGEELFFRGILQTGIRKLVAPRPRSLRHRWIAIGVTGAIFGFMHTGTPQHIPPLIVLGWMLGYTYERTGSLAAPILLHMLFNGKSLLWYHLQS